MRPRASASERMRGRAWALSARTFASLSKENYRRYLAGQAVSLVGTWMQTVAQGWLVLRLTGSGTALGLVVAVQFLPVLLLGPYGGVIVDRLDKRRLLLVTQSALAVLALTLGVLDVTHLVRLWEVVVIAACLGLVNAVDNPARQSFTLEMVGSADLGNAVSLNSVMVNAARSVGPAVAGLIIATLGVGVCFLINAGSYLAVIASLATLSVPALHRAPPLTRARGQLRAGLRYVRATPAIAGPLVMMGLVGTLAFEFQVVLPVVARTTFHSGAGTYGLMSAAMGVGAVLGGLVVATRARTGLRSLIGGAAGFGVVILGAAAAPTVATELVALVLVGAGSIAFLAVGNATLQLAAEPQMRGRVMSLWAVAFLGSTPIGGPIAGLVAEQAGPRWALALGGAAALTAALIGVVILTRTRTRMPRPPTMQAQLGAPSGGHALRAGPAMSAGAPPVGAGEPQPVGG